MTEHLLSTLGLALRAGAVAVGEEPVGAAARAKKARVIFTARDAAASSVRRAYSFGRAGSCLCLPFPADKETFGRALGRTSVAMCAVTDIGFAQSLVKKLAAAEPEIYGAKSYKDLLEAISAHAQAKDVMVEFYQSNHEGDLVDAIQRAYFDGIDGIVFNPAAYTHTSVAIADAVKGVGIPTAEVHISEVSEREAFRQTSYIRSVAVKTVCGHGLAGYNEALDFLVDYIGEKNEA